MKDRTFVDTNILVYAHDVDAGEKHEIAKGAVSELWESRTGVVSTQVLQELYVTLTRKTRMALDKPTVRRIIKSYASWEVVVNDTEIILQASDIEDAYALSFWDALIVSAAYSKDVAKIVTEDLQDGQHVEGILIVDPFKSEG